MERFFQGYQSFLPLWVYIILFLLTITITWWSYRSLKIRNKGLRYLLIALRSIAFLILLIVLLNPVFRLYRHQIVKPEIAVLLDDSKSMAIKKGDYQGQKTYDSVFKSLDLRDTSLVHYDIYAFGKNIDKTSPGNLKLNSSETDIAKAISAINKNGKNYKSLVLVTDGIFTVGRDPAYMATQLDYPVFTIAMGDTIHLKDIIIRDLQSNPIGYMNTSTPVKVTVTNDGFQNKKIEVQLRHNGKILDRKFIETTASKSVSDLTFNLKPKKTGLQQYQVFIPKLKDEWTDVNNSKLFDIDVRDDKLKILDISFEIHPDVKAIRSILETDKNIKLSERTWTTGDHFLGGNLPSTSDSLNLIILHGFPNKKSSQALDRKIENLIGSKPVILILSPNIDFDRLSEIFKGSLPIIVNGGAPFLDVQMIPEPDKMGHPIMNLPDIDFKKLPDVFATTNDVHLTPNSKMLFKAVFHGSDTKVPLLAIKTIGNRRVSEMNINGLFKWYQYITPDSRKLVTSLLNNIVKWTAARPDNRLLKIKPESKLFDGDESAVLNASLINSMGLAEDQARIEVRVKGTHFNERSYSMSNEGLGQYKLNLGHLPEGSYQFTAVAEKKSEVMDKESGQFSVGNSNIEFVNTIRNDALLHLISKSSGGTYHTFSNASETIRDMKNMGIFKPRTIVKKRNIYLYRSPAWFILILLLLSSEWAIRKYLAIP